MDWKLEVVAIPVSDVDRAKRFYSEQMGCVADHDIRISDEMRVAQLTPPGSACSIVLSTGLMDAAPFRVRWCRPIGGHTFGGGGPGRDSVDQCRPAPQLRHRAASQSENRAVPSTAPSPVTRLVWSTGVPK
jgi:catechol 2,3-dioxygenase-like lactoylglutathione lyase family enzyme